MSRQLVAASPLVGIPDRRGEVRMFYVDQPVTGDFEQERIAQLLDDGHLVEVDVPDEVVADLAALEVPPKSAKVAVWRHYAVSQGYDPAEAAKAKKADLVNLYLEPGDAGDEDEDGGDSEDDESSDGDA